MSKKNDYTSGALMWGGHEEETYTGDEVISFMRMYSDHVVKNLNLTAELIQSPEEFFLKVTNEI